MSSFDLAIPNVLKHEGLGREGIVHHVIGDSGGATNDFGVSLRYLKSLGELGDIDLDGDIDEDDLKKMTREQAIYFYRQTFWVPNRYEEISDQQVADKMLDIAINMGSKQVNKCLQRAIRSASDNALCLIEDGIVGAKTLEGVKLYEDRSLYLMGALKSEIAAMYRSFNQPTFINGWLNRAYS